MPLRVGIPSVKLWTALKGRAGRTVEVPVVKIYRNQASPSGAYFMIFDFPIALATDGSRAR